MMERGMTIVLGSLCAVLLVGCAAPPTVTTVSESRKRPANSREAIELQSCRGELKNTQVLLEETAKIAESASTALAGVTSRCAAPKPAAPPSSQVPMSQTVTGAQVVPASLQMETPAVSGSTIYMLLFPFGSTDIDLAEESAVALADAALRAPLIVIRGRTDGTIDSPGNQRVARGRADAVRDYLISLGVDPTRIRSTYQSIGDYAADNIQEAGRTLNRRAEVEVYETAPRRELLAQRSSN